MFYNLKRCAVIFSALLILIIPISAQTNLDEDSSKENFSAKVLEKNNTNRKILINDKSKFIEKDTPESFDEIEKPAFLPRRKPAEKKVPRNDYRLQGGEKEFAIEFGPAPFNPTNFNMEKEYDMTGRSAYMVNFRVGRVIGTKGPVTYQYSFGFTPLAVFTGNEVENPAFISEKDTPDIQPTKRETSYGFGIQPLIFRFIFMPGRRLRPFAETGAGLLFTNKAIPVPRSQPYNLTGDFGGGVQFFVSNSRAVNIGYRYFHISNGNVGGKINNPGYNANTFYINYSFFWK